MALAPWRVELWSRTPFPCEDLEDYLKYFGGVCRILDGVRRDGVRRILDGMCRISDGVCRILACLGRQEAGSQAGAGRQVGRQAGSEGGREGGR